MLTWNTINLGSSPGEGKIYSDSEDQYIDDPVILNPIDSAKFSNLGDNGNMSTRGLGQSRRSYQIALIVFVCLFQVDLYSGSVFLQQTLGWNIYGGVAFLLAITVIFTAFGMIKDMFLL